MEERGVGRGWTVQAWPFEKCKPSSSLTISRNPGRDRKGKFQYWLIIHPTTFIRWPQGAPELSGTIPFQVENMLYRAQRRCGQRIPSGTEGEVAFSLRTGGCSPCVLVSLGHSIPELHSTYYDNSSTANS